jgi:hypothetical protein
MTITITEIGSFSLDNGVNDPAINPSSIPDSSWIISTITANQIVANAQIQGKTATITINGSFDSSITSTLKTFADAAKIPFNKNNTVSSESFKFDGQIGATVVSDVPVQFSIFAGASSSAIVSQLFYSGKLIFNAGNGQTNGDSFYGYSGYATFNDPHLYNSSHYDTFVGGTGGVNTLILPANKSSYSMTFKNNIFDNNSKSANGLSGWELTDKSKTYATVDISNVQRIQFKDTTLALDTNANAGEVAKVLGAVFGPSFATNKQYIGIGLDLADKGMSYSSLMGLALGVKLGAGYTNEQEIQLLYQNLFGHTATTNEVSAIDSLIKVGQYTQATLGVLAADTTNNAANINLVGLAQTGIEYTPVV